MKQDSGHRRNSLVVFVKRGFKVWWKNIYYWDESTIISRRIKQIQRELERGKALRKRIRWK